jgi:hypothetical protein
VNLSRYLLTGLIGVVIGVGLMLVLQSTMKTLPSKSNRKGEYYAWEKTPEGQYRQVKKSYFMNQHGCESVIASLNEMSTNQPRSSWVLSHTTESTFECWPADVTPNGLIQEIESPYSDDQSSAETQADEKSHKDTATELFDLRTKCAACAKKVLQDYYPDRMPGIVSRRSSSHYDPKSGRCFVELKVWSIPQDPKFEADTEHKLVDGQTQQQLAKAEVWRNGTRTGVVSGKNIYDFVGTEYYIKKMMGENAVNE